MKGLTAIVLVGLIASGLIIVSSSDSWDALSVGVKEGDWIEYCVNIVGNPPAVHRNVTSMRIEALKVEDTAFPVNLIVRYANGTVESSIWKFNFTEGNTEGWIIIPSGLGSGDTFFDNFSKTNKQITIQSQQQKTVLGETRTATYANDTYRQKEWDKATGVFTESSEVFRNWSAYVKINATNIWNPPIRASQILYFELAGVSIVIAVATFCLVIVATQRKRIKMESRVV